MHSSRMRTARSLPYGVGSPWTETPPLQRPPPDRDCPDRDPPDRDRDPPVDRQTPVKTLPYPKLRLRVVINEIFLFQSLMT